jgi:CRISPR locus-related DNA-binding protein
MRLAVTIGFESRLVIRAVARIPNVDDYVFLRARTGGEGDQKSAEAAADVIKALGRGRDYAVDVRDLAKGLEELAALDFDAAALAGGPRALILLTFIAASLKGVRIYVLPEYAADPIDATAFSSAFYLTCLSPAKLRVLAEADGPADELARRLGLDSTTVYRHLEALAERGLVKVEKARAKVYRVDEVVKALARMLLQSSAKQ